MAADPLRGRERKEKMDQSGVVVAIKGKMAVVEVKRVSACGDKCSSCGGGCDTPVSRIEVANGKNATVGDLVTLNVSDKVMLQSTFLMYTLPLIGLIFGIVLASWLTPYWGLSSDLALLGTGLFFMGATYYVVAKWVKKGSHKEMITMKAVMKPLGRL